MSVQYQADYADHGNIGFSGEWRSMPDVVGKTMAQARPILAKAHLPLEEHFEILEGDCAAGTICEERTYPRKGERKVLARKGRLYVGVKVATPTTSTTPTAPATQPTKPAEPGGFF